VKTYKFQKETSPISSRGYSFTPSRLLRKPPRLVPSRSFLTASHQIVPWFEFPPGESPTNKKKRLQRRRGGEVFSDVCFWWYFFGGFWVLFVYLVDDFLIV